MSGYTTASIQYRQTISDNYRELVDIFKKTCINFEPFRSKSPEHKPELRHNALLNLHPKLEALYSAQEIDKQLSFCIFIAPEEEESHVDMPKIRNSVESFADVSTRVNTINS